MAQRRWRSLSPDQGGKSLIDTSLAQPRTDREVELWPCSRCHSGYVFLGRMVEENGEEVEVFDRVECRKCGGSGKVTR